VARHGCIDRCQAEPAAGIDSGVPPAVKPAEHVRQLPLRDTDPSIAHCGSHPHLVARQPQANPATGRRKLDCIVEQIAERTWLVLHRQLRQTSWLAEALWIRASALGGLVGYRIIASWGVQTLGPPTVALAAPYENLASHIIFVTLLWTAIGLAQWPVLRPQHGRARWWVPASTAGGALSALTDNTIAPAGGAIHGSLLAGALAGAAYGNYRSSSNLSSLVSTLQNAANAPAYASAPHHSTAPKPHESASMTASTALTTETLPLIAQAQGTSAAL
jgi:hypothetical protein